MKNRNFLKYSIGLLLPISLGIGVLFGISKEEEIESSAYSGASLPTTIYLNDPSETTIRNYYSKLNNLNESERQGDNLLKNLKTILSNGQKYYNYDSGDLVWQMYEITDRDWDKSPASSTTYGTYDSEENKITNYVYGSNSNGKNNPYVRAFYMDRNQENVVRAWGNHKQDATGINREHLWAKAQGFGGSGAAGARGDPMHLVAANGYANNIHSNNFYGYVDKDKSYTDVKDKYSTLGHNYSGYSKTFPSSEITVFEPQDCDKGDIARAIFYMAARYNNIAGKDASQETFDADNPNLLLTDDLSKWKSSRYTSTAANPGYHGLISDLLEWNRIDKPDAYEIHRNNLLYTNFTNNRNPFIDFPEWADYIWGNQSASATPATDSLNGGGGSQTVTVTSIEVTNKPTKLVYTSGDSLDLTGMIVKANMSDGTSQTLLSTQYSVTPSGNLKTSDTQVIITYQGKTASFDIAVKSGGGSSETFAEEGDILLSESFNNFSANAVPTAPGASATIFGNATVTYSCVNGGSDTKIYNENYALGEKPELLVSKSNGSFTMSGVPTGGARVINVTYKSNNTNVSVSCSSSYKVTGSSKSYQLTLNNDSAPSTIDIVFSNLQTGNCRIDDIVIDVETAGEAEQSNVDVTSISLNKNSTTLEIGSSEQLTATVYPSDATVKIVGWNSSASNIVSVDSDGRIVAKAAGTATITCSALDDSGVTATCSVTVNQPVTLQSISLSGDYATEFYLNDEFSNTGMIVTANYSNGTQEDVSDEAECSGFNPTTATTQTITVSYGGITTTYTVTVKESRLDSNQRMFIASKAGVGSGEVLDSYTDSPITVAFSKNSGSNTPKYFSDKQSFRVYGGNSFTIIGTKKITKIEFEMATGDYVGSNAISASEGSFSNNVWTGNAGSVVFTVAGTSGQRNIVSIKVTYDENSQDIKVLSGISLSGTYKTEFFRNETFSYEGLTVTANYTDGSSATVTPTSVSSPTMSTTGSKTVTVSYTENGVTKNAIYDISVIAIIGVSIELTGNYKTEYKVGDTFSTSGMTIVEHLNNGSTDTHSPTVCSFTGYNMNAAGTQTVTVHYNSLSTTYQIKVVAEEVITYVATITSSDFSGSYADNNRVHSIGAVNKDDSTDVRMIDVMTNQVQGNGTNVQFQRNAGYIYNTDLIGTITDITITSTAGIYSTNFGESVIDSYCTSSSTATSGKYFNISNGNATGTASKIVITFTIPANDPVKSLRLDGSYKTSFGLGSNFEFGGIVYAVHDSGIVESVTDEAEFSGFDSSSLGQKTITVSYAEKTTTYKVTIIKGNNFRRVSGKLISGYYLLGYTNDFMSSEMKSSDQLMVSKLQNHSNTVNVTSDTNVFYINVLNDYITIKSKETGKYLASTSSDSKIACVDTVTDQAKWTVTTNSSNDDYLILNISRETAGKSSCLKGNTTTPTAFACYSKNADGKYLSLYRQENTAYVKADDLSWIQDGDHIAFGLTDSSNIVAQNSSNDISGSGIYPSQTAIKTEGNYTIFGNELMDYEVHIENGVHTFKCELGYLSANGNGTEIQYLQTATDLSKFTLTEVDGNQLFKCLSYNRYIKWNTTASYSGYRIGMYTTTVSYKPVSVFISKEAGEAHKWSADFLASTNACKDLSHWSEFGTLYNNLSNEAKTDLKDAVGDQFSTSLESQAMARYDYILGDSRYDVTEFIDGRGQNNTRKVSVLALDEIDTSVYIVVIVLVVGLGAIGGYFFYKKRKEDRV